MYRDFAYEVPYHILRRLTTYAIKGFESWSDEKGVIALCDVWIRYMATQDTVSQLVGLAPLVALQEEYRFEYVHYWPPKDVKVPGFDANDDEDDFKPYDAWHLSMSHCVPLRNEIIHTQEEILV